MRKTTKEIASLDPAADHERIVYLMSTLEFAWDIEKSLEFALFRTYAVPSISGLLARTGEFERRTRKRYDDTELILSEISENGLDSVRGRAALGRMNAMHARYRIANDEFIYVLSTFIMEPIRWLDRFGRRPMTQTERLAWLNYYRALGARMGIRDIPATLPDFDAFNRSYENANFQYAESNARIAACTRDLLLSFYMPRALVPFGRPAVHALMDVPLRNAMGMPAPFAAVEKAVLAGLRLRRQVLRFLPARRHPRLITRRRRPTYPFGYRIEELGTFSPGASGAGEN